MSHTLLDVRASGQAALIPLGAHRVCSTLPTGVWLLNCPESCLVGAEVRIAGLPQRGRCSIRFPLVGTSAWWCVGYRETHATGSLVDRIV